MTAIKGCPLVKKVRESSWRSDTRTEIGRLIKSKPGQEGKDGYSLQKEQHVLPPKRESEGIHGTDVLVERGGAGRGESLTLGKTVARLSHISSRKPLSFLTLELTRSDWH